MKHTHIAYIEQYAKLAKVIIDEIEGATFLYRKHNDELTRWRLQQLIGELHGKTTAMISEAADIVVEEIEEYQR